MFKKVLFVLIVSTIFMAIPTFAAPPAGCKNGKFVGTYTSATPDVDIFGDGSVVHTFTFQLTLNSDGIANLYWTGSLDYQINTGTNSPWIGSWECRRDGKLVVNLLNAGYAPTAPSAQAPNPDVALVSHSRTTFLFTVDDQDTLTRTQSRTRVYEVSEDPTDAAGGTLLSLNNSTRVYKRMKASDADLLAP